MAIGDDFGIAANGDIRVTGTAPANHTVLALKNWLGGLQDDAQAVADDLADITTVTIFERSTDKILTLNGVYNIDDTVARHLYDGSISQNSGDDLYSGVEFVGTNVTGTELMIMQDGKILPPYWGTGINADAANLILMRLMIKSRSGGADIDGKRIITRANELGDNFAEFPTTMGLGVAVSAVSTADDGNNNTVEATIRTWSTIANIEGQRLLDIDNDTVTEEYYSEFDKGSQSLNDVREFTKMVQQRASVVLNGTDTATDYTIDNATIVGQAQSFTSRALAGGEKLVECRFRIKIDTGAPTGDLTAEIYATAAGIIPTGAALATSEPVLASQITTAYAETIFRFNDNFTMAASTQYAIVIRHPNGGASDFFAVEGAAVGGVAGENKAEENPVTIWTAQAGADLWFTVKGSPVWHGRAGELHRGITHEVLYDTEVGGPWTQNEIIFWGTQITYDNIALGPFVVGDYCTFEPVGGGAVKVGGKILKQTATVLHVQLDNIAGSLVADNDIIRVVGKTTTADVNVTITDDDKEGGEGVLFAVDDNGLDGELYVQIISGKAPVNNLPLEGRASGATALVATTVNVRTISPEFLGGTTGSNLIGAYGIGFETTDIGSLDKFIDLSNTQRIPPNNVTVTVTGLVSGEDRVLVGPRTGALLEKGLWLVSTLLSGAAELAIVIKTGAEASPIATDTPQDGTTLNSRLRVQLDSGIYRRQDYTSYAASTFTIPSTNYSGANQASVNNDVFPAYIDVLADATTENYTAVYGGDRDIKVRVRDGGGTPIKTFESDVVFGSTDSSIPATRTPDA